MHADSAVSIIKVNYSYAPVSEGEEKKRKPPVKNDCGQNEARKVVWKRLQSSSWKKSFRLVKTNVQRRNNIPCPLPPPPPPFASLAGRCEVRRVSLCSRRLPGTDVRAVWHLLVMGSKRRIEVYMFARLHLWGRKCTCRRTGQYWCWVLTPPSGQSL